MEIQIHKHYGVQEHYRWSLVDERGDEYEYGIEPTREEATKAAEMALAWNEKR